MDWKHFFSYKGLISPVNVLPRSSNKYEDFEYVYYMYIKGLKHVSKNTIASHQECRSKQKEYTFLSLWSLESRGEIPFHLQSPNNTMIYFSFFLLPIWPFVHI